MADGSDDVREAINRWVRKGLVAAEVADHLRSEVDQHASKRDRRVAQYALAGAGAVVLLVATGVLADSLWPLLGVGARAFVLACVGVAVHWGGWVAEGRSGWKPAGYLLQTAGLVILLGAFQYSGEQWTDATLGGVLVGLVSLAVPLLLVPAALRRNPVMPAVHLALGLGFVAVFLDRATTLSEDAIVWTLDGLLLGVALVLVGQLRGADRPDLADRTLYAVVTAAYCALVLLLLTALGPLSLESRTVWAIDSWLVGVAGAALWGLHAAPLRLRRDWFEAQLGLCVVIAIPLAFLSADEVNGGSELTALLVAAVGAVALWYGVRFRADATLRAGALAVVVAAWYYGVDRGGAIGVVLALALTAGLLFWLSKRVGPTKDTEAD